MKKFFIILCLVSTGLLAVRNNHRSRETKVTETRIKSCYLSSEDAAALSLLQLDTVPPRKRKSDFIAKQREGFGNNFVENSISDEYLCLVYRLHKSKKRRQSMNGIQHDNQKEIKEVTQEIK